MFGKKKKIEEPKEVKKEEPVVPEKKSLIEESAIIYDGKVLINSGEPSTTYLHINNKVFMTIEPDGKMIFNKNNFPGWREDNFARAFVNVVEEISGCKNKK